MATPVSGSYKIAFSPDLSALKGLGQTFKDVFNNAGNMSTDAFDKAFAGAGDAINDEFKRIGKELEIPKPKTPKDWGIAGSITDSVKNAGSKLTDPIEKAFGGLKSKLGPVLGKDLGNPLVKVFGEAGVAAGKEFADKVGDNVKRAAAGIGNTLAAVGKVGGVALGAAGVAVGGLGAAVVKAQAEIQQSLGGSEAVFQDNAQVIQNWAAGAAGSMGVSTNAALETANKMGSLFQGAGHSVEKSAEMTMGYSQRAADVASVMGLDLASAMEAVTGAAKGNYTMMDNLGVAMNETSLAAYAAEKGYEGQWSAMDQATKTGIAYELFMERTAQYAGNFAKENQTLAGSFDILKSSWQNVLSSAGDSEMLSVATDQLAKSVTGVITSVSAVAPQLIGGMVQIISDGIPILIDAVTQAVPLLITALVQGLPPMIDAIVGGIVGLLPVLIDGIVQLTPVLIQGLLQIVNGLIAALPEIITQLVAALITMFPLLLEGAIQLFMAILLALPEIIIMIVKMLPDLITQIVTAIVNAVPLVIDGAIKLFMGLATALPEIIGLLIKMIPGLLGNIVNLFIGGGYQLISGLWNGIAKALPELFKNLGKMVEDVWKYFTDFFDINSPSKLMADTVGFQIGAGIGEGIEDSVGSVLASADAFNGELYDTLATGAEFDLLMEADIASRGDTRIVNQYNTLEKPDSLADLTRAAKRGTLSGLRA